MFIFRLLLNACISFMVFFPFGKIGPVPAKLILLAFMIISGCILSLLLNKTIKQGLFLYLFFFGLIFPSVWLLIGFLNNNAVENMIDFVNVFPLLSILFFVSALFDGKSFKKLMLSLISSINVLSVLIVLIYIVLLIVPESRLIISQILGPTGLGGNISISDWGFIRIILRNNIFIPLNLFLLLAVMKYDGRLIWKIFFALNLTALILGFTKAFIVGLCLAVVFFLLFEGIFRIKDNAIKNPVIKAMIILLFIVISFPLLYRIMGQTVSGFDMSTSGNIIRMEQNDFLVKNINEAPLWGRGFGAKGENNDRTIYSRDFANEDYFELQYIHLIFQLGLFGILIFGIFLIAPILIYFYEFHKFGENKYFASAVISIYIGFLFYAGTNPYLMDSSGFLNIIIVYLVLIFSKRHSKTALLGAEN